MRDRIKKLIKELEPAQNAAFVALTCEKMLPNYFRFSEIEKWGNSEIYTEALTTLYGFVLNQSYDKEYIVRIMDDLEANSPDLDEFDSPTASYALDTSSAMLEAVSFLLDGKIEHIYNCATYATDTVDMFIQELNDLDPNHPNLGNIIDKNGYMVNETERQERMLKLLTDINRFDVDIIKNLRVENGAKNLIDIEQII